MPLLRYQERRALGCRVQLALVMDDTSEAEALFKKLWLEILYFEKRCSRFLPDSELSQLNRAAGTRQFVSPELRDVLLAALAMAGRTGGLYNPFVLPAVQRAGYVRSMEPDRQDDAIDNFDRRQVVSADRMTIGEDWANIPYGTALDLGGCGKGYIGDALAAMVRERHDVAGFWFSIGGDTILGGCSERDEPWTVYLQPDPKADTRIGEVIVPVGTSMAVATSSTRFRRGAARGKAWHHIIDPRNGSMADTGLDLATVCSPSLLTADVLATCVIIAGPSEVSGLLSSQSDVTAAAWQAGEGSELHTWGQGITVYDRPRTARNDPIRYHIANG